jgi:hypothetical protein
VRGDHGAQGLGANQRRITWQNQSEFRRAQCAARYLYGVTSAALRLLQHAFRFLRFDYGGDLLSLMTYHRYDFSQLQWDAGGNHVFHEAASTGTVQNLRYAGLQPRPLSRG